MKINTIESLRKDIDDIDEQLLVLLNKRAKCSLEIRALKPQSGKNLFDPKREEYILSSLEKKNTGPLYSDGIRAIYHAILRVMKETPYE